MDREAFKRQVLQSTDIVRLIGEHLALKPKGREHVGLCPFHDDKKPSMTVAPAKQIYKCFACGAGGDAFSFVMAYLKMSFPEALRYLAEKAGLQLPAEFDRSGEAAGTDRRKTLQQAHEAAVRFYQARLGDEETGKIARHYLAHRKIDAAMIEQFAIGYAPDQWDALAEGITRRRMDIETYVSAGLVARRHDGSAYDRFRHRLMIPIYDGIGRPIAFGGRILPDSQLEDPTADAKYINSPESELFNKSATLFGLNHAKRSIIKLRTSVIVEGYLDVIACHQYGFTNVVATLGTALTPQHARELRRYCEKVVLVFDADEAGQKAADRAMQVFFGEPMDVAIAVLPTGQDPADVMFSDNGPATWQAAIDGAIDAMDFHFQRIRTAFEATDTIAGRQRVAEEYLQSLVQLGLRQLEPTRRGLVMQHLADLLRLDLATVDTLARQAAGAARQARRDIAQGPADPLEPRNIKHEIEKLIVGSLLADPSLFHATMPDGRPFDETVLPGDLAHLPTHRLYERIYDWLCGHDGIETADLRSMWDDEASIGMALDLRMDAERKSGEDSQRLQEQFHGAIRRWTLLRADQQYADHALQNQPTNEDEEDQRIARALEHARSAPSATRMPRVQT